MKKLLFFIYLTFSMFQVCAMEQNYTSNRELDSDCAAATQNTDSRKIEPRNKSCRKQVDDLLVAINKHFPPELKKYIYQFYLYRSMQYANSVAELQKIRTEILKEFKSQQHNDPISLEQFKEQYLKSKSKLVHYYKAQLDRLAKEHRSIDKHSTPFELLRKEEIQNDPIISRLIFENQIWSPEELFGLVCVNRCSENFFELVINHNLFPVNFTVENQTIEALACAIMGGYHASAQTLIQRGANVNFSLEGHTALHYATKKGDLKIIKLLLDNNADVNAKDEDNKTPLCYAVEQRDIQCVRLLLNYNPTLVENSTQSPFHIAVGAVDERIVSLFIEEGVDVNNAIGDTGDTPLHLLAKLNDPSEGHADTAEILIQNGANLNKLNAHGKSALEYCFPSYQDKNGNLGIATVLLNHGADPNISDADGNTILLRSLKEQRWATAKLLVSNKKTDLNKANNEGVAPLDRLIKFLSDSYYGSWYNSPEPAFEIAKMLICNGAELNKVNSQGQTPLNMVCQADWNEATICYEIVKLLIEAGADPNIPDSDGMVPLLEALLAERWSIAKLLIANKKTNLNQVAGKGCSPLIAAIDLNHLEIVKHLIDNGAQISIPENCHNETPLHLACKKGNELIVQLLLEKGASVQELTDNGWTPLHRAADHGHLNIVKLLLKKGADIMAKNKDGDLAVDLAKKSKSTREVEKYLSKIHFDLHMKELTSKKK